MICTEPRTLDIAEPLKELVDGLLGSECRVEAADPIRLAGAERRTVARYLSKQDEARAVILVDWPFMVYTGAALSMIPNEKAAEHLRAETLDEEIRDNAREILNVVSATLNDAQPIHLRIDELFEWPSVLDPCLANVLVRPKLAGHFELEFPEYGRGRMSIFIR